MAGFLRQIREDEEGTLARLMAHRRDLVEPEIAEHRGRASSRSLLTVSGPRLVGSVTFPVHQDGNHPFGDRLSRLEARFRRRVYRPIRARIATRLAGPRVGAFWRPGDPAWISLPGPAWLGAR